jgi:hypothetical protein
MPSFAEENSSRSIFALPHFLDDVVCGPTDASAGKCQNENPSGLIFSQGSTFMAMCLRCNQRIRESVVEGRKLIALVHKSPCDQPRMGRFLTILKLSCGCGDRTERRYENRPMGELNPASAGSGT